MDDDNYNYEDVDDIQEALDRTPVVVLLIVATVSFYFLALVTEEVSVNLYCQSFFPNSINLNLNILWFRPQTKCKRDLCQH